MERSDMDLNLPQPNFPCLDVGVAPVELICEFLVALNHKDFHRALALCEQILLLEPDNKTCIDFKVVLQEKIKDDLNNPDDETGSGLESSSTSSSTSGDETESSNEDSEEEPTTTKQQCENSENILKLNLLVGGLPIKCKAKK